MDKVAYKYSVIILAYNNYYEVTKRCIDSVLSSIEFTETEVIIVDNNSQDATVMEVENTLKGLGNPQNIKLIKNPSNLGYAAGNNVGIAESSGEFVVLLNNDTIVMPNWLEQLASYFTSDDTIGMIGPISNSVGNEQQVIIDGISAENFIEKWQEIPELDPRLVYTTDLGFFCVMIRRPVIEKIGLLDVNFGMGMFEDTDYCIRVKKAGYKLAFSQGVFVYHHGSFSFKKITSEKYSEIFNKNLQYFRSKHGKNSWGISLILKNFWVLHKKILQSNVPDQEIRALLSYRLSSIDSLIDTLVKLEGDDNFSYKNL